MRTIGVVTVGRSDYGVYLPVLRRIEANPELRLQLIVAGMHLSPEFGMTVEAIEKDGFEIAERVEMTLSSDTPEAISKSTGLGLMGYAQAYARNRPDILLVLGDRFEMHAAALAALPFNIPVAHLHGGELTFGAIDDALRHSITKLSHLHFASTQEYAQRIHQLGEEPWRITVSGAPGLDNLKSIPSLDAKQMEAEFGIQLDRPSLLVTYHPVTLEYEDTERQIDELLAALDSADMPVVFTAPNADTNGRIILRKIEDYVASGSSAWLIHNLRTQGYFSLMSIAAAMVGNSSSGIVEGPSFGLPVVNIGNRQAGRMRSENILDVGYSRHEILEGIRKVVSPEFRQMASQVVSPYGDGNAAERIVSVLASVPIDERLITKRFADIPHVGSELNAGDKAGSRFGVECYA